MTLKNELNFPNPISLLPHEALLNIYHTSSCLKKMADEFFRQFDITDVQFNLLMLLKYQSKTNNGLSQADISKMMLVNRANVTSLVDRMEKANFVTRTPDPNDRRYNIIVMTENGANILKDVELLYANKVKEIMGVITDLQQKQLINLLENIRHSYNKP